MTVQPRHAELWWCAFPDLGARPAVVLSRDAAIAGTQRVVVAPCTTRIRNLPSEVRLEPGDDPVPRVTAVNLDGVTNVSKAFLTERVGQLSHTRMAQVCAALEVAVDCG